MSDIDAYFARIGYDGPRAPTLAVLRDIVACHTGAIPFENVDVQLGRGIRLDAGTLADKLLLRRRGGYCFEQNTLLMAMLRELGFAVAGLAARVEWGRPAGPAGPRTHMLLCVELPEGPYLADVGFGGLTPTGPLRLDTDAEQRTPHESFRVAASDGESVLQARLGGAWADLYRFAPEAQEPIDYEVANWFTATHPQSLFINHLIAMMPAPGCRYTLFDDSFAVRGVDGRAERRRLAGADDLGAVLSRHFALDLPRADLEALAARLAARAAAADPFEANSPAG